jgi:hypothetical protein
VQIVDQSASMCDRDAALRSTRTLGRAVEDKKAQLEGRAARTDPDAESASPDLPAFIARPPGAPPYHGFLLLPNSELDGFVFGVITDPRGDTPASWGDAYVIAPDGSRAGIVWSMQGADTKVVMPPDETSWGVYFFRFDDPVRSDADLVRNLHGVLPRLKLYYASAHSMNLAVRPASGGGPA